MMKKRNTIKKCLSFICIIVSCISLIACANNPEINTAENETAKGEQTKENKKDNKRKYEKQESVLEPIIQEAESDPTNNESFLTQLEKFKNRQSECGIDDENIELTKDMIPVIDAIDRYFQAINEMDAETINEIAPGIAERNQNFVTLDSENIMKNYLRYETFELKGFVFADKGYDGTEPLYKSFGFASNEDYREAIKNNQLEDLFKDFHATYELHAIKELEDCAGTGYMNGLNFVGPYYYPKEQYEEVERHAGVMPDQMYMVNLTTVYTYGDKLYGYDEKWWEMDDLTWNQYSHWIMYEYNKLTSDIRVYKYNGEWYIYSINWNLSNKESLIVDYHTVDKEVKKQYYEELESE